MVSHDATVTWIKKNNNIMLWQYVCLGYYTKTVKDDFGSSLFFQNSEHPKIGYFGHYDFGCNKLSFDWLNMFLVTKKKRLVLVG